MPIYRKKPVEIEAQQFHGYTAAHINGPVTECNMTGYGRNLNTCSKCGKTFEVHGLIPTLEGEHIACPGDYIIKGIQGEFYPCKPDIFEQTYDLIK